MVAEDKGNSIALLTVELDALNEELPKRIKERELLEQNIVSLEESQKSLKMKVSILLRQKEEFENAVHESNRLLQSNEAKERSIRESISDLEDKRLERNKLAEEIKDFKQESIELDREIKTKENLLKSLELRLEPINLKIATLERLEKTTESERAILETERVALDKQTKELRKLVSENEEALKNLTFGGKTMGHYIRGVQKKFDELGIKIDFLELLNNL